MTLTDFQNWAWPKRTGRKDFAQERKYKEERKEKGKGDLVPVEFNS